MEFVNLTPFSFAYLPGRNNFPGHSLTLIVKGTFKLRPGEVAVPVEDQPFPTGDEPYPDDEEGTGAPRYENDFAPFKPRTDLLLVGNCHPPGQAPVPFSRASFRVGPYQKAVNVIGDRTWKGRMGGWTDPVPFTVMPVRYENSFGGEGFAKNPAGKGNQSGKGADDARKDMLPNIEDAQRIIRGKGDQPDPVGFGPLNRMWQERFAKVGTYKGDWKETRFPAHPIDFDWAFFNSSPSDLQVEGYLRGDEELTMENLHPEIPLYASQLPGFRVRCFVEEDPTPDAAKAPFREVEMNLDTLWVDMEAEVLTLVWRGVAEVGSEEFEEIANLLVCAEQVADAPQAAESHREILHQGLADLEREWSGADEDEVAAPDDEETDLQDDHDAPEEEATVDPEIARVQAEMAALQAPAPPPPAGAEEPEKTREEILAEAGAEEDLDADNEIPRPLESRQDVEELIAAKQSLSGRDLRNIDLSNLVANDVDFSGANLSGVCLVGSNLAGSFFVEANLEGADLSQCNLAAANLSLANIQSARLMQSVLSDADFTGSQLMQADLSAAEAKDAIFGSAQLDQGQLVGIQAQGADFSEAKLNGANLESALLDDTNFSGASVQGASFKGSSLRESDWAGAEAPKTKFDQAEMAGFRATEGCDFSAASFREAKAVESNWQGANLTEADFSYAEMAGADFTKACLHRTCLEAADMAGAKFHKADLEGAKLVTMNLFQGSLEQANLKDADLSGSNMYGVEFQDAIFNNTVGKGTNLKMTKQDKG